MQFFLMIKRWLRLSYRGRVFAQMSRLLAGEENSYAVKHSAPELSPSEVARIKETWSGVVPNIEVGVNGFKCYKKNFSFDPEYVPFSYFFPWIVRILNPIDAARVFANKGLTYTYFTNVSQPKLIARRINGCSLSAGNCSLSNIELVKLLSQTREKLIIKASAGSCCGKAVRLIAPGEPKEALVDLLSSYKGDFVIQEAVKQSPATAIFNESSLNTFRISTLLLNGKFSVCTAMLRFGKPGNVVDNVGAGGGCVGVSDDGCLMPFGFSQSGEKITEWNGVKFEGCKILEFQKVIDAARRAHYNIPLCAFVGWDIAIDENGEANLIEANLDWPGLFFEQLANARPAFRERFNEVLDYCRKHPLPLQPIYDATN